MAHYPINLQQLNKDFITGSAHKFHGPKEWLYIGDNNNINLSSQEDLRKEI